MEGLDACNFDAPRTQRFAAMLPETGPTWILFRRARGAPFAQNVPPIRQAVGAAGSMMAKRLGTARHLSLQRRKLGQRNENTDGPPNSSSTFDVSGGLERDDHLMHSWRGHAEVPLDVRLCRRPTVDLAVVVDEREVLALASRECGLHWCMGNKGSNVRHERRTKGREAAFGTSARWSG